MIIVLILQNEKWISTFIPVLVLQGCLEFSYWIIGPFNELQILDFLECMCVCV